VNVPEITVTKVHAMRERGDPFTLLDIREKWESDLVTIDGSYYCNNGGSALQTFRF
jgi:hypothetical protein